MKIDSLEVKVLSIKEQLELVIGLPVNLIKLSFNDDADLLDNKSLKFYQIYHRARIQMKIFHLYETLINDVVHESLENLKSNGIFQNEPFSSPTAEYMMKKDRQNFIKDRNGIAIYVASHRGLLEVLQFIQFQCVTKEEEINLKYRTPVGRTALHVASFRSNLNVINFLLNNGIGFNVKDVNNITPLKLSEENGNDGKDCSKRLIQQKWMDNNRRNERPKSLSIRHRNSKKEHENILPFLRNDSQQPTWLKGPFMQLYFANNLSISNDFSGTMFNAPKRQTVER
ncbi:hypothetical protein SNEBB_000318 [Seison nebaliae]|nr:hypothetical protein SNEBB_000318 [Seison nebaliae]